MSTPHRGAERDRKIAWRMTDVQSRMTQLQVAAAYEQMARTMDEIEKTDRARAARERH